MEYTHFKSEHNLKAPQELVPFIIKNLNPSSVIDIGCGIGTFLHVFEKYGIYDVFGVDGDWVDSKNLLIQDSKFMSHDLNTELRLEKRFDLVLCLEVVEHLKQESADQAVQNLILLGDVIIFSAAIECQGGQNHLNERHFDYWQEKFSKHGYHFYDLFRPYFWNNHKVDWWYKQNTFLVIKDEYPLNSSLKEKKMTKNINLYIHPDLFYALKNDLTESKNKNFLEGGHYPVSIYLLGFFNKIKRAIRSRLKK